MNVIETPTGRFAIVGFKVPTSLVTDDTEVQRALYLCGPGIARKIAERKGVRFTTSYATREEAEAAVASVA